MCFPIYNGTDFSKSLSKLNLNIRPRTSTRELAEFTSDIWIFPSYRKQEFIQLRFIAGSVSLAHRLVSSAEVCGMHSTYQ